MTDIQCMVDDLGAGRAFLKALDRPALTQGYQCNDHDSEHANDANDTDTPQQLPLW